MLEMRNKTMKSTDMSDPWQLGHTILQSDNFFFSKYFLQVIIISIFQEWFNVLWKWPNLKITHISFSFSPAFLFYFYGSLYPCSRIVIGTYYDTSLSLALQLTIYWCVGTFMCVQKNTPVSLCAKTYHTKIQWLNITTIDATHSLWVGTLVWAQLGSSAVLS